MGRDCTVLIQQPKRPERLPPKVTVSPVFRPDAAATPALISKLSVAGADGEYGGRTLSSESGGGLGTSVVISATAHEALIQTMSNGKRMSFIQKVCFRSSWKMNSMPVPSSRTGRPDYPWKRFSGVSATSTVKATPLMVTVGMVPAGVEEGVPGVLAGTLVGTSVGVFAGVGMTVSFGGTMADRGVAVGAPVSAAVAVGGWIWGTSPPQDIITADMRPIAVQIN